MLFTISIIWTRSRIKEKISTMSGIMVKLLMTFKTAQFIIRTKNKFISVSFSTN